MRIFTLVLLSLVLTACSSLEVNTDWDHNVNFNQIKTYFMLDNSGQQLSPFVRQRISDSVVAQLEIKGLKRVEKPEDADVAVGFEVATENRTSYTTVHSGFSGSGFHHSRAGWGVHTGTSRTTQRNYTVGTLIIAIFEMESKDLKWEGSAQGNLNSDSGQDQARINAAVEAILLRFPPEQE